MGIWDPSTQFTGPAAYAVHGWLSAWKVKPIIRPIDPWHTAYTTTITGAKRVTEGNLPIHPGTLQPWDGKWIFSENTGLWLGVERSMWQIGTRVNMFTAAEFDVGSFDMSPDTMAIKIGNNAPLGIASILNGCYSGRAQDAAGNVLPAQLRIRCRDQIYGQGGTGLNGSGTLAIKSGDTANYKPVNPADTSIGSPWYNCLENFDLTSAPAYVALFESFNTRKDMNNVELGLAGNADGKLELLINFGSYERTRLLLEVFQRIAGSGVVTPIVVQSGVNNTDVNSLVQSYNDQVVFSEQTNPAYGRVKVRGVTGLRTDLAVLLAPPPPGSGPEMTMFLHAQGGKTGEWQLQNDPAALGGDTVPHISVFPWTQTTGPMFSGAMPGSAAGDIGLSMLVAEGFAAVSGLRAQFLFTGSAS